MRTEQQRGEWIAHNLHTYRFQYRAHSLSLSFSLSSFVRMCGVCFSCFLFLCTLLLKLCACVFVSAVCARAMESKWNRVFNYSANIITLFECVVSHTETHTHTYEKKESGHASNRDEDIYTQRQVDSDRFNMTYKVRNSRTHVRSLALPMHWHQCVRVRKAPQWCSAFFLFY